MIREIIDVPEFLIRATSFNWDIDWRGQSAGADTGGGEQIVVNRFPRWTGSPTIALRRAAIPLWRTLRARARGRQNAWRIPMIDPLTTPWRRDSDWASDWQAWNAGQLVEDRPQIPITAAALAGDATLAVDETVAPAPVAVGAVISYADWPMLVTGRSGAGALTLLEVEMLRVAIPLGAMIDLIPRGIFLAAGDAMGNPAYDRSPIARIELSFNEWITR
jgi:hypothetical protein